MKGHSTGVFAVAISPDGQTIASVSKDRAGALIHTLEGHKDSVRTVAFSADGRIVATGSNDKTIKLWNVLTGEHLRTLVGHKDLVNSVAFNPNNNTLVLASSLWLVKRWQRSAQRYNREREANLLQRQLKKLPLDLGQFLEGRSHHQSVESAHRRIEPHSYWTH